MEITRERAFQAKERAKKGQHGGMVGARVVDSLESVGRRVRETIGLAHVSLGAHSNGVGILEE